jgi:hypothetical protein
MKGDRVYIVVEFLHNDCFKGVPRHICLEDELFVPVGGVKD